MLKTTVIDSRKGRVVLMDSITKVDAADQGSVVLSGSHGGVSSGEFALEVPLRLVLFNDAGVGKNNAGIAALGMLETRAVAGATVSHDSGQIGDARDMWENGIISHVNPQAARMGLKPGANVKQTLLDMFG